MWATVAVSSHCNVSRWLLLVLSFAPRGFCLGTPVFPSPQKRTFPNSHSTRNQVDEEPLCGCATSKSLFIYLFIIFVVGSVSLEFFIFPALSLHCSLSCNVSTSDMPSQPMTQERMAPNID